MSTTPESIVNDVLEEGLTDWVPVDRILGAVRELALPAGTTSRDVAASMLSRLIEDELMAPGDIGSVGFEPWPGSTDELAQRAIAECQSLAWQPMGAGFWMANTSKGDQMVQPH